MAYPEIKTTQIDGDSIRALSGIPTALHAHGIAVPKQITEATEHHRKILEHISTTVAAVTVENAHDAAARALANGTGTAEQVATAAATQTITAKDPRSPFNMIVRV